MSITLDPNAFPQTAAVLSHRAPPPPPRAYAAVYGGGSGRGRGAGRSLSASSAGGTKPPWQNSAKAGLAPPAHRAPPVRPTPYARMVAEANVPVDQMMRLSVAEQVEPELYSERGNVVWLRSQNIKLGRANRRLQLELSRLEAAASTAVGDGTLEALRTSLLAEHERERERDRKLYRHELELLQSSLSVMTQRVDELQGKKPKMPPRGRPADVVDSRAAAVDSPLARKLATGKMLTAEELAQLRQQMETATADTAEVAEARKLATEAQAILRRDPPGLDALRRENESLRHELTALRSQLGGGSASSESGSGSVAGARRPAPALPGSGGSGAQSPRSLAEENQSLKALLLATEEQCARLVAALSDSESARIQQGLDALKAAPPDSMPSMSASPSMSSSLPAS